MRDALRSSAAVVCAEPTDAQFGLGRQVKVNVHLNMPTDVDQPFERVLRVDVIDQGVGIKEEDCDRIFDPYVRAASTKGGGTGLGLHSASCLSSYAPPDIHPSHSV